MKAFIICFMGFFLIINTGLKSQTSNSQAFNFVGWPHSVRNFGMGMQGVASTGNIDALTYNPANLVFTKDPQLSFYHNNSQIDGFVMPINDFSFYYNAGKMGSFGIEYLDWDWGNVHVTTVDNPDGGTIINPHQRSIAFGYANKLNDKISLGADLRYCTINDYFGTNAKSYLLSIGINDKFFFLRRICNIGFSIMNIGPAVKFTSGPYETFVSPPTFISGGFTVPAIENNFLSVPVSIGFSKPFDKRDDNGSGQSSFKTLFTDWKDFPNDASVSPGLALEWKPINLGDGFYFSQSYYLGNYSMGIKSEPANYYTHGAEVKLEYNGIKLSAGYSGIWFNRSGAVLYSIIRQNYPYEGFQFSISANERIFSGYHQNTNDYSMVQNIIVSAGAGQLLRIGKAKYQTLENTNIQSDNNPEFSIESAFYFRENTALVAFVSYNSMPLKADYFNYNLVDEKFETFTAGSLFRYHPFESLSGLFLQAGLGITRINPVLPSSPMYYYIPAFIAAAGYNIEINNEIILAPTIGYNLSLKDSYSNPGISDGENQFNIGIKLGYRINL